jgi:hypothetical protein
MLLASETARSLYGVHTSHLRPHYFHALSLQSVYTHQRPAHAPFGLVPTASAAGTSKDGASGTQVSVNGPPMTAKQVALAYYERYNAKRIDDILELLAEDAVYEDLVYQEPFRGRAAISAYLRKVEAIVPPDVRFVVEDITDGDPLRCGVRWHVELEGGIVFPFSRGTSFYQINEQGQIVFARDVVEPTFKPGASALQGIAAVAPLVRRLGPAADPAMLKRLPIAAAAMGGFWLTYLLVVLGSTVPPGNPAWQTSPEVLQTILNESFNFFYVNIGLTQLGINIVPCVAEHPVSEALFNFVSAWSLMFWPAMVADPLTKKKMGFSTKFGLWLGVMFLTNVFMPAYMALRLVPDEPLLKGSSAAEVADTNTDGEQPKRENNKVAQTQTLQRQMSENIGGVQDVKLPGYAPVFGGTALAVGLVSLAWAVAARPEFGNIGARYEYFMTQYSSDRVFWAFCVDAVLYWVWQVWLMGAAGEKGWQRWTPFFGMALWLMNGQEIRIDKKQALGGED